MVDQANLPTVVITGVSGYLGSHVCLLFLQDGGFKVRGTVRSVSNAAKIDPLKKAFGEHFEKLELVEADLLDEASLSNAIKGADIVVHTASPFYYLKPGEPEDNIIKPAVEGTLSVGRACRDHKIKKLVVTSSCAAVLFTEEVQELYNESHWSSPTKGYAYVRSKTLAEKAIWDFQNELSGDEKFELSTINPGFILGPPLSSASGTSVDLMAGLLTGLMPAVPNRTTIVADVRDVAKAHLQAVKLPEASNKRFCLSKETIWITYIRDRLLEKYGDKFSVTRTVSEDAAPPVFKVDNTRSREVLGIEYARSLHTTIDDMADALIEMEFVVPE